MARSGESSTMAPSRCERKVTPCSSSLRKRRQRHHLEAAGIGQDRQRPVHERVQAAERGDALGARPQHQMVGVAEHDLGAGCRTASGIRPFTVALRADRHEGRRLHAAMRRDDLAAARGAVGLRSGGRQKRLQLIGSFAGYSKHASP